MQLLRRTATANRQRSGSSTVEELIRRAVDDERKRGPAGLSFAPIYSFTAAVAHMARGQERQTILDALAKTRPEGKSAEFNAGFDEAISAAIRILVERSHIH
jgi:hypothetical protein